MRRVVPILLVTILCTSCSIAPEDIQATVTSVAAQIYASQTAQAPAKTITPSPYPTLTHTPEPASTSAPTAISQSDFEDLLVCYQAGAAVMVDAHSAAWLARKYPKKEDQLGNPEISRFFASRANNEALSLIDCKNDIMTCNWAPKFGACAPWYETILETHISINTVDYTGISSSSLAEDVDINLIDRTVYSLRYTLISSGRITRPELDEIENLFWEAAALNWGTPRMRLSSN